MFVVKLYGFAYIARRRHPYKVYRLSDIYTCKLPSSISGCRSKSTTYGALASGLRSSHVHYLRQQHKTREAKEQADFSGKYSETNPLKKLDWNMTDERILF